MAVICPIIQKAQDFNEHLSFEELCGAGLCLENWLTENIEHIYGLRQITSIP